MAGVVRCCPVLSGVVRCCPVLSAIVRCCPLIVRYCPLLSFDCPLMSLNRPLMGLLGTTARLRDLLLNMIGHDMTKLQTNLKQMSKLRPSANDLRPCLLSYVCIFCFMYVMRVWICWFLCLIV